MKMRYNKQLIFAGIILSVFLVVYYCAIHQYITRDQLIKHAHYLHAIVAQYYIPAVIFYCLFFIAATVLYLPITILLTIAGGFLFGIGYGLLYATLSATLGSTIVFLLVRYLIGNFVQKRYKNQLATFNEALERHGYNYLLMLQLLPATPTFLINTLAGLTSISLWTFVWTTFVGIIPGSLLYTYAGRKLYTITSLWDIFSVPIILIFILLALSALIPVIRYYTHSPKNNTG